MKPKLLAVFLLIVCLPLGLLGWFGVVTARGEQQRINQRFDELLASRLRDIDARIMRRLGEQRRGFSKYLRFAASGKEEIRAHLRRDPIVSQLFVLNAEGKMTYPSAPLNKDEQEFMLRSRSIWINGGDFTADQDTSLSTSNQQLVTDSGWRSWYYGEGLRLIYWQYDAAGQVIGTELNRSRMLADIIGALPSSDAERLQNSCIRLLSANGKTLYQWGGFAPEAGSSPRARIQLGAPLQAWALTFHAPSPASGFSAGAFFNLAVGLLSAGVVLIGLALYFYREHSREMLEARSRVNFVNQVSHELKTPLTNIRMYAELLERELDDEDEKSSSHLRIIVTESQRLSRMIANVLTLGRKQSGRLRLYPAPGVIDDVIHLVADLFRPALENKRVEVKLKLGASGDATFDHDALKQIIGNLLSNVEKYAADGRLVTITSVQTGEMVIITVADHGPGIPENHQSAIFDPFVRLSDKLTEGVAGTGIGLTISRELARLHGGDLRLVAAEKGACFELSLRRRM